MPPLKRTHTSFYHSFLGSQKAGAGEGARGSEPPHFSLFHLFSESKWKSVVGRDTPSRPARGAGTPLWKSVVGRDPPSQPARGAGTPPETRHPGRRAGPEPRTTHISFYHSFLGSQQAGGWRGRARGRTPALLSSIYFRKVNGRVLYCWERPAIPAGARGRNPARDPPSQPARGTGTPPTILYIQTPRNNPERMLDLPARPMSPLSHDLHYYHRKIQKRDPAPNGPQTEHKRNTNGTQTEHKPNTNRTQTAEGAEGAEGHFHSSLIYRFTTHFCLPRPRGVHPSAGQGSGTYVRTAAKCRTYVRRVQSTEYRVQSTPSHWI